MEQSPPPPGQKGGETQNLPCAGAAALLQESRAGEFPQIMAKISNLIYFNDFFAYISRLTALKRESV